MIVACFVWFVGCIIQAASQSVPMLIVGRIIAGMCVGLVSSCVPVSLICLSPLITDSAENGSNDASSFLFSSTTLYSSPCRSTNLSSPLPRSEAEWSLFSNGVSSESAC